MKRPSKATSTPDPPRPVLPQYRLVGGKGGVGKTTCAAAMAIAAASKGVRTLVISTDPAPSLGDALGTPLGPAPKTIPLRRGSLRAVEVDAQRAIRRWLGPRTAALEAIALRGTWLDREDVSRLLALSLPGIDELAALLEIVRLGRSLRYDLIVVDTAPTGHTLRMVGMPNTLAGIARVFDHMQAKHRALVEALRGSWRPDAADALIDELDRDARDLTALLADPRRLQVSWVTLPEPLAIDETLDAIAALEKADILVDEVVVNRTTAPPPQACRWCNARRSFEHQVVTRLRKRLRALYSPSRSLPRLAEVTALDSEPVGVRVLAALGRELGTSLKSPARPALSRQRVTAEYPGIHFAPVSKVFEGRRARLVLFAGKGGVGKTTCAAAAALEAAVRFPDRRVLLLSTDPAHSLGDVLDVPLGDSAIRLPRGPSNLEARELDADAAFASLRTRYASAVDAFFDRLRRGSAFDAVHDREVMRGLIDLAPPGIDEIAAVLEILDALTDDRADRTYDLVVMDTAPTGHALRLLEMPIIVQQWSRALMAILLKYQSIVGVADPGRLLLRLSRSLGRLRALMTDPIHTQFVVVTRAAALPRIETVRLLERFARLRFHASTLIVNAVGRGSCSRCRRAVAVEEHEVTIVARTARRRRLCVVLARAEMPPPRRAAALIKWRKGWVVYRDARADIIGPSPERKS